jgi:hypothetical protein
LEYQNIFIDCNKGAKQSAMRCRLKISADNTNTAERKGPTHLTNQIQLAKPDAHWLISDFLIRAGNFI